MRAFEIGKHLAMADAALAAPPALARLVRPKPRGRRVARFALPLEACKPQNRTNHRAPWAYQRDRSRVAILMGMQARRPTAPLPGRPMVVCTRFSSVEPDAFADWAKMAVDVLCLPDGRAPNRLGFLVDDKPGRAEIVQRWEPAKPKYGFVLIEVFEDENAPNAVGAAPGQVTKRSAKSERRLDAR
jgi:hypothetical protein